MRCELCDRPASHATKLPGGYRIESCCSNCLNDWNEFFEPLEVRKEAVRLDCDMRFVELQSTAGVVQSREFLLDLSRRVDENYSDMYRTSKAWAEGRKTTLRALSNGTTEDLPL